MKVSAVILAAGKGERFGGDKVMASVGGKPVWRWSFDAFSSHPEIDEVGLVCSASNLEAISPGAAGAAFVVPGGVDRQESSRMGVENASGEIVLIHDGARPFVSADVISRVIQEVKTKGAAAPAVEVPDTLRISVPGGHELIDRSKVLAMQTPQGAFRERLLKAHQEAGIIFTDDIALLQSRGNSYGIVEGSVDNFKITTVADLDRARAMMGGRELRTGFGYDIHAFSADANRPLMLGGVLFEDAPGLEGHSDADVLIHAAVDALLGSVGLGDIGQHFPNTDPRWKDQPSLSFLQYAARLLRDAGWEIVNLDIAALAEKPKIMPRAVEMKACLAEAMGIDPARVSVKATTNEGLGAIGRGEGIAAYATATVRER